MGYFPNGASGMDYEDQWCSKCVHQPNCTVWLAHLMFNYDECNKKDSILHMLIPLAKDGSGNEKCTMFHEKLPHDQRTVHQGYLAEKA